MARDLKSKKKPAKHVEIPDIEKSLIINASIDDVWSALTDPSAIGSWTDDDSVKIDLKIGGAYEIFGGETTGYFIAIEKPDLLEYSWRMSQWKKDWPDSVVRWELKPYGKKTKVHLMHTNLPDLEQRDGHDEGWDIYFLEPMKKWLESKKK